MTENRVLRALDELIYSLQEWRELLGNNIHTANGNRITRWKIGIEEDTQKFLSEFFDEIEELLSENSDTIY